MCEHIRSTNFEIIFRMKLAERTLVIVWKPYFLEEQYKWSVLGEKRGEIVFVSFEAFQIER